MVYLVLLTSFTLLATETLAGMVTNGFIVLIICNDWLRSKKLSPPDLILGCLGLSRLMWQAVVILKATTLFFFKSIYIQHEVRLLFISMFLFTNSVNIWFAAWLSVLYFVKIAIFSHPVFLRAKQRFSGVILWLLAGSVVFSAFVNTVIITAAQYGLSTCNPYKIHLRNSSDADAKIPHSCKFFIMLAIAPNFIPMIIFLSSSVLLITSLWKHTRRLQRSGTGTRDRSTQTHLTAVKALASFTVLYMSSFVTVTSHSLLKWTGYDLDWTSTLFEIVSAVYPLGHAAVLILINPKLKQAWIRMLYRLKCRLREPPS